MLLHAVLARARALAVVVVLSVLAGGGWLLALPGPAVAAPLRQEQAVAAGVPEPAAPQKPVSLAERRKAFGALAKSVKAHALPAGKGGKPSGQQAAAINRRLASKPLVAAGDPGSYSGLVTSQISQDPLGNAAAYQGNPVCLCDHTGAAVPGEPLAESAEIYQTSSNTTTQESQPVKITWQITDYCTSGPTVSTLDFGQTVSAPNWWTHTQPGAPAPPVVNAVIPLPSAMCQPDSQWTYMISVCTQVMTSPPSTVGCGSYNAFLVVPFLSVDATHGCVCGDASGAPRSEVMRGDPVNTATGAYAGSFTDASVAGVGVPFTATRSYGSDVTATGALGKGWSLPWETSLQFDSGGNALLHGGGGALHGYTKNSDGTFSPADAGTSTLSTAGGGYTLTTIDHHTYTFDSGGHLTAQKDSSGQGLSVAYTSGLPTSITDAAGRTVALSYVGALLSKITLADGRHVDYGYTAGQLTSVRALDGATTTYGYDAGSRLNSVTDPLGHRQVFTVYDPQGRVSSQTDATGNQTAFAYTTASVFSETDTTAPDGGVWSDFYSGNMLFAQQDPLGNKSYFAYDKHDNRTDAMDGNGHETSWVYYDSGLLKTKKTDGLEQWRYDSSGNPSSYQDGNSQTTAFTFGANNLLATAKDPLGHTTGYTYWPNGELKTATTPLGKATSYDYFADGSLKAVTTPEGRKTSYTYDGSGRVKTVTDPRGNATGANPAQFTTTYGYDDADRVTSVTDANGHTTTTKYDLAGNVHTVTDAANRVTTHGYDNADRLTTVTDPAAHTTVLGYDAAGRRNSVTDRTGGTTTTVYNKAGEIASMVTARGNVTGANKAAYTWTYGYDHTGNRTSTTDPQQHTTLFGYDTVNRPSSTTDPNGHTRTITYDHAGNVTSYVDALGHTTTLHYNAGNQLDSSTTALAHKTTYEFDDDGNLTGQLSPMGEHTTYGYDGDGLRTTAVDPRGHVGTAVPAAYTWTTTYDEAGQPVSVTDPQGHITKTGYDAVGNVISATDARGKTASTTYDELDRVKTTVAADGGQSVYAYDPSTGFLSTVTDPGGHVTTYGQDNQGRVTSVTDPLNRTSGFTYDAEGNRYKSTSARGQTITASIDARDLTGKITYSDTTPAVIYTYDNAGRMSTVADATGSRTLTYFDNDQLKSVTAPGATQPFTYDYNSDGTPNTRTYPDGTATAYGYDNDGRTTGATIAGKTVTYGYDAAGNPTTTTLPAGQRSETQTFDTAGRLSKITEANGAATTATAYGYDPDGRVTDQTATSAGGVQTPGTQYAYDSAGRLTRSCLPASVGADCASTTAGKTLAYDKAGNLLSTSDTTTPMDWTGATQTVSADLNGDGITDVITADATNTIRTYLGQGDGTFLPAAQITGTGTGFKQLMPIEYTGDGKTDLLAIDNATGHLLRYTGDGKGGFAAPADLGAGWGVMTLTPGDFNGDGKNDFLAISSSSGNMNFYAGKGDGTVGTATALGAGWGVMTLTPGDFNGDGKLDVLAVSSSSHRMNFYPGNGNGTLGTATLQADSWATYGQPATGHFDAGATLDIVAPDTSNHLRLWHGDGAGHLTGATITTGGTTNTYNTADQLTQTLTGRTATAYGYDLDGNQTTAGSTTNTYDPGGRLTTSTTGSTAYAFTYDADGNRATVKKNGTLADTTRWDINNPLPQIATETNATGALIGDYQYNPAGAPQSVNTTSSNAFYYLHNQQNSITAVLDGTGAQTYHYSYDTYGTPTATADVTGGQQSAFGFTGQYKDPALTGRLDLRDRILDTTTGRFTTRDPVPPPAGSANPSTYAYANNDPVNLSDPTGDCPLCISALVGAGIGALVGGTVYAFQHRDGNFNWADFAASTGKGAIIGLGAGLLMPAGGAGAAFLGFEEGTASYLATSATINGLAGMGYTWAVNTAQCQPTNPRDLLFGFAGGFFGTYAGPAFNWAARGMFGPSAVDSIYDMTRAVRNARNLGTRTSLQNLSSANRPSISTSYVNDGYETSGTSVKGKAAKGNFTPHPDIKAAYDRVPPEVQGRGHGFCGEVVCLSNARNAGQDLSKGTIVSTQITKDASSSAQGEIRDPCSSCQWVLDHDYPGITVIKQAGGSGAGGR